MIVLRKMDRSCTEADFTCSTILPIANRDIAFCFAADIEEVLKGDLKLVKYSSRAARNVLFV